MKIFKNFLLFLLVFITFGFVFRLKAEEKTVDELYRDFSTAYLEYQGEINNFETQKKSYLEYQSSSSQFIFLNATKKLLKKEIQAIVAYIRFLKASLSEATLILNYKENYVYVMLDAELSFFEGVREKIDNLSSLAEAKSFMNGLESHYQKVKNFAYLVKYIREVYSAEKILDNIKAEKQKIDEFLSSQDQSSEKVMTARERLNRTNELIQDAENSVKEGHRLLSDSFSQPEKNLKEIREKVDLALNDMRNVVSNWIDLISFVF